MPKVELNDIDLYYEDHGKGFPLVLISGLSGNTMSWMTVLNALSKHFRVITFDNRGAGQTGAPEEPFSVSQMADDLKALLDHLGIENANILGHSMGGFIAQEFALKYPDAVNKLILYATSSTFSKRNQCHFENMYNLWKEGISMELWFREFFCWIFSNKVFEDKKMYEFIVQFALDYPYQQTSAGFKGQLDACDEFDTTARLKDITSRTLIIAGDQDILITPDESRILKDNIPNSELVILENTAHTPHIEDKEEFTNIVLDFFQ